MEINKLLEEFKNDHDLINDFCSFFFNFKPHFYQEDFLKKCFSKNRIAGKWSRQSGKSQTVAVYCNMKCLLEPTSIMIIAPTQSQSSELYDKIRVLAESNETLKGMITKSTATELKFTNGSRIKALPSGPEGASIRGYTADIVIIEESGKMKDEIVNMVIIPMIASKLDKGQIIKIGTPLIKNHFHRSCFIDPNYEVVNVTWREGIKAGQYTQQFIDEQRLNLLDIEFRSEYEAEFCEEESSFFSSNLISSVSVEYELMKNM